jgi:hypothetical protein
LKLKIDLGETLSVASPSHSKKIGIVGSGEDKFTTVGKTKAKEIIRELLSDPDSIAVSGHSPMGGVDMWVEEISRELGKEPIIFPSKKNQWSGGYKDRNLQIAEESDEVHVIVTNSYPLDYKGRRFNLCYHCNKTDHIKSGGCWTANQSKKGIWHIIDNGE